MEFMETMFEDVESFWKNMLNFDGRSTRKEYWTATLWNSATQIILFSISFVLLINLMDSTSVVFIVFTILFLIFVLLFCIASLIALTAISIRRCHDVGFSGWIYALCALGNFFYSIGSIAWLVICCIDSKDYTDWGESPKKRYTQPNYTGLISGIVAYVISCVVLIIVAITIALTPFKEAAAKNSGDPMGTILDVIAFSASQTNSNATEVATATDEESKTSENNTTSSEKVVEETTEETITAETNANPDDFSSAALWKNMKFTIDGNQVKLPCKYSDITDLGFSIKGIQTVGQEESLEARSYMASALSVSNSDKKEFDINFVNLTYETKPFLECDIYSIMFDSNYELPDVLVAGKFKIGMTYDEILDILGNANYEYKSDTADFIVLEYYSDEEHTCTLKFSISDGKVSKIGLAIDLY